MQYVVLLLSAIEIVTLYFVALVVVVAAPEEDPDVVAVVDNEAFVLAVVESVLEPVVVLGAVKEIDCRKPRLLAGA